jgi:hypothetical protein
MKLILGMALSLSILACGGEKSDESGRSAKGSAKPEAAKAESSASSEQWFEQYGALKERACACADKACASAVLVQAENWMLDQKATTDKFTEAESKRFIELDDAMKACGDKLGAETM